MFFTLVPIGILLTSLKCFGGELSGISSDNRTRIQLRNLTKEQIKKYHVSVILVNPGEEAKYFKNLGDDVVKIISQSEDEDTKGSDDSEPETKWHDLDF